MALVLSEIGGRFKFVLKHQLANLSLRMTPVAPKSLGVCSLEKPKYDKASQEREIWAPEVISSVLMAIVLASVD